MEPDVIVRAAELASIHSEILAMPMGYETVIGEGGGNISGGQRQRICLARALARQPRILLFDEATSELDVLSERAVQTTLATLPVTRILIAHRVSTVRSADLILVFNDGEVVERGTHDELMARGGLYAEMVNVPEEKKATLVH
jgi:ABC-type multidrug transport system fused ATPase/permease subunit